jgi:hypothetical protein
MDGQKDLLAGCVGNEMNTGYFLAGTLLFAGNVSKATNTLQTATVTITFEMGGSSGFAASIDAQEVPSGKMFKGFYPAGSHSGMVLPTPLSVVITVGAPGTCVVFGNLIEALEDYHYGAAGCTTGIDCTSPELLAINVVPGSAYQVTIYDRHAPVPTPGTLATVPWRR